jgi:hypothetical protein
MLALGVAWALTVTEPAETGPVALSRLLDEIRRDTHWREAIEAAARPTENPAAERLAVPPADAALADAVAALAEAVAAADAVVPIESGRPVLGDAMAALRRQIHAEIRIYQDRQTLVNQHVTAALRRLVDALDPAGADALLAALWSALGRMEARVEAIERVVGAVGERAPLEQLGSSVEALAQEVEPVGRLRLAVETIEARLAALERARPSE